MIDSIRRQIVPIHPEGYKFIAIFAVIALILWRQKKKPDFYVKAPVPDSTEVD
jgi:hypothetical protein